MSLSFIISSGNVISEDFCEQLIYKPKTKYFHNKSFGISGNLELLIAETFESLRRRWEELRREILREPATVDDLTSWNRQIRDRWIFPFFRSLGYELIYQRSNFRSAAGIEYHFSHLGWNHAQAPVLHITHVSQNLDQKDSTNRTHKNKSPQDSLQNFLNTDPHHWAILSNGKRVRLLRDFHHSITKGFLEFDLEGIFETADTSQFRLLYQLLHRSRIEGQYLINGKSHCLLEKFHHTSIESGIEIGNKLRTQVREAIELLGNGFVQQMDTEARRQISPQKLYTEVLNVIYRILFLSFAEQKGWLPTHNSIYAATYSLNHLRSLAVSGELTQDRHTDLWEGLIITFYLLGKGHIFPDGTHINAFGGQLFSPQKLEYIGSLPLANHTLLSAIAKLCFFEDQGIRQRINYTRLSVEALGSVYESLLDFEPVYQKAASAETFSLQDTSMGRKSSGSYYTDSRLVAQLINSALIPVIEQALEEAEKDHQDVRSIQQAQESALLALKVCDPACGSGHFLIAALETLGNRLALIRKGSEDLPTEQQVRQAKRDVLQHCIYGVDLNPMALELAKFSLWITASMPDFPLSFLDHRLKCGNSLIGATPELIQTGIPVEAYKETSLDNKALCQTLRKRIKSELALKKQESIQTELELQTTFLKTEAEVEAYLRILRNRQETYKAVEEMATEYRALYQHLREGTNWKLADTWTAAFFIRRDDKNKVYPTNNTLDRLEKGMHVDEKLMLEVEQLANQHRFFHWHLEFPEVFGEEGTGGFDCVLGNPPWERVKLQEKEFFRGKNEAIVKTNKTGRKKLIHKLASENPVLFHAYKQALDASERTAAFLLKSNRYPLCGRGDVNTYTVFTEHFRTLLSPKGRTGIIVPTGIATDNTTKFFFADLVESECLVSLYDFENKKALFKDVHRSLKFCLLTMSGSKNPNPFDFLFFATHPDQLQEAVRHFSLTAEELFLLNPNTGTCPIFRSKVDAELTKKIYRRFPVLVNEKTGENILRVSFVRMFDMTNDSHLFRREHELEAKGFVLNGNRFENNQEVWLPLYESKLMHQFDHRFGSYENYDFENSSSTVLPETPLEKYKDPEYEPLSRYWVSEQEVLRALSKYVKGEKDWRKWSFERQIDYLKDNIPRWFLGFRDITNTTNERTGIFSIIPPAGVGNTMPLLMVNPNYIKEFYLLYGYLNSFVFDYIIRQKMLNTHLNFFILKQLPIIHFNSYSEPQKKIIKEIIIRLTYTSNSLQNFARDINYNGAPFTWNEEERFQLRCELDAIYGKLYGLTREEFDYILDTFPIVRRKDEEKYGEYRTKRVILEEFDKLEDGFHLETNTTLQKYGA